MLYGVSEQRFCAVGRRTYFFLLHISPPPPYGVCFLPLRLFLVVVAAAVVEPSTE